MTPRRATARGRGPSSMRPLFTVAQANAALVLIRRVVNDIVARYDELMELRAAQTRELHVPKPGGAPLKVLAKTRPTSALDEQVNQCVATLNRLYEELSEIGCVLKDWQTGLVDFPAQLEGRRVWLCWRLGEPAVAHWHERDDGVAGRKPLDDRFA